MNVVNLIIYVIHNFLELEVSIMVRQYVFQLNEVGMEITITD